MNTKETRGGVRDLEVMEWDSLKKTEEFNAIRYLVIKRAVGSKEGCLECGSMDTKKLDIDFEDIHGRTNWRGRLDFLSYRCVCTGCKLKRRKKK